MSLSIHKDRLVDESGRNVLIRGVNVSGSAKVPATPNGATHIKTDFHDHHDVSFVGRPFTLKDAHEHCRRIAHWGFNALRFLVPWEAIEHAGPGKYDIEFLNYLEEVLKICGEHGLYIVIDPAMDVWSRMSGGDGAPGWTFEQVGLDITKLEASEAAITMQQRYDPANPLAYGIMYWGQNKIRFGAATLTTLFFAGKDFAPSCKIDGENAQDYLQGHFFNAYKQVATRVKDMNHVLGLDTMNEPDQGWIERKVDGSNYNFSDTIGHAFTPFDAMCTAAGIPRTVSFRELKRFGIKETKKEEMNKNKVSCWSVGAKDIWQQEGVWGINSAGAPTILKNDHFYAKNGQPVEFCRDYLTPFISAFAKSFQTIMPRALMFVEGPGDISNKGLQPAIMYPPNAVNAPHWYDLATIGLRKFMGIANFDPVKNSPVMGKGHIQKMFIRNLGGLKTLSQKLGIPLVLAEFGLPYDLDNGAAYKKLKDNPEKAFETHVQALSQYYDALDANLLSALQWNYTPDNTNKWGDGWNVEDFSIFSIDQQTNPSDINSGGRAIEAFCRPHFVRVAGTPQTMDFNHKTKTFLFEFDADAAIKAPTILFVPKIQYPSGFQVKLSEGEVKQDEASQTVEIRARQAGPHQVMIGPKI